MDHQPTSPHLGPATDDVNLSVEVPLVSGEAGTETLRGELHYSTADPYAVTLVVHTRLAPVAWTFSRELLADGIYEPVGDGDVQIWPCLSTDASAVIVVELHAPTGDAFLQTPSRAVQTFVDDVHTLVPPGAETAHLGLDVFLSDLLGG